MTLENIKETQEHINRRLFELSNAQRNLFQKVTGEYPMNDHLGKDDSPTGLIDEIIQLQGITNRYIEDIYYSFEMLESKICRQEVEVCDNTQKVRCN